MADEEDAGDFLEREKKNDPLEKITKYMEEDLKLRKEQAAHPPAYAVGSMPVSLTITMNVRKIENGWILAIAPDGPARGYGGPGEETYFQTAAELVKGVAGVVDAFTSDVT